MPFDGVAVRALAIELRGRIIDSRIERISMPSRNEVVLIIRNYRGSQRLYISADPSLSSVFLTEESVPNPAVPPNFCMFLRKHIGGGVISDVTDYGFERYLSIGIKSRTALGDLQEKRLVIELTGRNCNIVLLNESGVILDALKHIDSSVSSVREIMPARNYIFIPSQNKMAPDEANPEDLHFDEEIPVEKLLLSNLTGFSPILCREVCHRSSLDPGLSVRDMSDEDKDRFKWKLGEFLSEIKANESRPCIVLDKKGNYSDFHCMTLTVSENLLYCRDFNEAVSLYFMKKRNKASSDLGKSDLVKAVARNIERCRKKVAIHAAVLDKERSVGELQLFGELITANIHLIKAGSESVELLNYYTGEQIKIALDPHKNAVENAQRYYKRYKKTKSAIDNSRVQMEDSQGELEYLESVSHWLDFAKDPEDIKEIRQELAAQGYIKKKHQKYKKKEEVQKFHPHKYISSEGYEIYAGRNNIENDHLTFKFANSRDLWLHAKGIPGSHVIIRRKDKHMEFFPDRTITEGAMIAAYHSKARSSGQIAVDYSEVRNIKKPGGAKPGMVNYFEYFSAYITVDEETVRKLRKD
ncbi:MAG: NFACT family protein [Clostridia bacterium]|nr:NFACT family protein [Clostridia bacterium]MBN2883406.1 NFACT family protein [Clostridia bacterium]